MHNSEFPKLTLNDIIVPHEVDQFKFLGHLLTPDLKDNREIERDRTALSVWANMIARRFAVKIMIEIERKIYSILN